MAKIKVTQTENNGVTTYTASDGLVISFRKRKPLLTPEQRQKAYATFSNDLKLLRQASRINYQLMRIPR